MFQKPIFAVPILSHLLLQIVPERRRITSSLAIIVIIHVDLYNVNDYYKMILVINMLYTYAEAQEKYGSPYQIERKIQQGSLFKLAKGLYSDKKDVSPYAAITKMYPDAIITMDSAFFIHGLTDVVPDRINLATRRNSSRIRNENVRQFFLESHILEPGKTTVKHDGVTINIYSLERMLIELMRNSASMPLDYYKEIISNYRKRIDDMDIRAIEDYMQLFKRNDYMFDILQREVM